MLVEERLERLVALGRVAGKPRLVALAAGLGMLAGWYDRAGRLLDVLAGAWSAVPSLFFALIPLALINRLAQIQSSERKALARAGAQRALSSA